MLQEKTRQQQIIIVYFRKITIKNYVYFSSSYVRRLKIYILKFIPILIR